jgi:cyclic pyranopterin phosphate synthase
MATTTPVYQNVRPIAILFLEVPCQRVNFGVEILESCYLIQGIAVHFPEGQTMAELSHFDDKGASRMVDTTSKPETERFAKASALVRMKLETLALIKDRGVAKGDVFEVARLAGIMAAKKTSDLIPLCHPLPITGVTIDFSFESDSVLRIEASVKVFGKTGVEMEALTAVSVAALTVYDMCKSADRGMRIECIRLEEKSGGKSGTFTQPR